MLKVDYRELGELNKQKQGANSWYVVLTNGDEARNYDYVVLIAALRGLQWRHRDILEFLLNADNELYELNERNPINNTQLSKIVSKWNTKGLLEKLKSRILSEIKKIQGHKTQEQIEEELVNEFRGV